VPRPKDRAGFFTGCWFLALGAVGYAAGIGEDVRALFAIGGAVRLGLSFFVSGRLGDGKAGPGTLRATPTRRFRATGLPPSKNPDDYR
jgi:hypothetical protein